MATSVVLWYLYLFHLFFYSLFVSTLETSKLKCQISLNRSLLAGSGSNSFWSSPSGEFAFGFRLIDVPPTNDTNPFMLAIWYKKITEKTVVWSINDEFTQAEGSKLELTTKGELELYDHQGLLKWSALKTKESLCAAMDDSGNFVLLGKDYIPVWESFENATDTLLPGQRLMNGCFLTSRLSEENYKSGRFKLHMQADSNLVLYPVSSIQSIYSYWAINSVKPVSNKTYSLMFHHNGYIEIEEDGMPLKNITTKDLGRKDKFYWMARIDSDGAFRVYRHPRNSEDFTNSPDCRSWYSIESFPEEICEITPAGVGSGPCGYNSYCVSKNGKTHCLCPEGYSFKNPLVNSLGCRPNFQLPSCQNDGWETMGGQIDFVELNNTDWPLADYEFASGSEVNKETCKELCREDCFCAVAIYDTNRCWKKKLPLTYGRKFANLTRIALIKIPKSTPVKKDKSNKILILSIMFGSSVFVNFLLLLVIVVFLFLKYRRKLLKLQSNSSTLGMNVRRYTYKELEKATEGFKQKLGSGAFGTVYKGVLPSNPKRFAAIKKLERFANEGEKEFQTEVRAIGQTHHKNLVCLLGYCEEGEHRLLVYEYMCNGSLASFLFGISRPNWNQRLQIAFGIARGLMYLHEECSTQIIHCDIKPQNILLDEYFTPRISDFGLAKLLLAEQTRAAKTGIRGTIGYFAPEWFKKASITVKVDAYSFGVVLLELVCCRSCVEFAMGNEEALIDFAYNCYYKKKIEKMVENDEEAGNDIERVRKIVMIAIWCIQEDPSLRPTMRKVTQMLEGVVEISVPPRPSGYSSSR